MAVINGMAKRMTRHLARRTFTTTVLLYNDVLMEVVSELLRHSHIKITQESYGMVAKKRISFEVERLKG